MHFKTKQKISFLQSYIRDWIKIWSEIHPGNITGFRISRKIKQNKEGRNYAIVFQVEEKKNVETLTEENKIPSSISVQFPDGITRKIPTDIIETGKSELQIGNCTKPLSSGNLDVGTIGVLLQDNAGRLFALTNYHVAAIERMLRGQFNFTGNDTNIYANNTQADFVDGIFADELDVAFLEVSPASGINNQLAGGNSINNFAVGPYGPAFIGKPATVYCTTGPTIRPVTINNNSASWNTGFQNLFLQDLLSFNRVTQRGNSGSPVMIGSTIIGIIVGADALYSYAIPYYKIHNYKPLQIV